MNRCAQKVFQVEVIPFPEAAVADRAGDLKRQGAKCMATRVLSILGIACTLLLANPDNRAFAAGTQEGPLPDMAARCPSMYAALYAFPETREVFVSVAGAEPWETHFPRAIAELLDEPVRLAVVKETARAMRALPDAEQRQLVGRLRHWCLGEAQLELLSAYAATELVMASLFSAPETRDTFTDMLQLRGWSLADTPPLTVGETLSSAEQAVVLHRVLTYLSALPREEQLRYFRDLYDALLGLLQRRAATPEGGADQAGAQLDYNL
jgi:hypothetical protein